MRPELAAQIPGGPDAAVEGPACLEHRGITGRLGGKNEHGGQRVLFVSGELFQDPNGTTVGTSG